MTHKTESGQALVLTAVALVALLGVMGLAIDMGVLRYDKRLQQTAADAAALAGASNLGLGETSSGIVAGGLDAARTNGFADTANYCGSGANCLTSGSAGYVTVTINSVGTSPCNGPCSGPHKYDRKYVEALVSEVQPTYFMRVLGVNSETVVARAVATAYSGTSGPGTGCIYTTGLPTQQLTANSAGVGANGSVILNAPDCGIIDNGNLVANGGAQLSITASSIAYGGTYKPPSGAATVSPDPTPLKFYTGDPLAGKYPIPTGYTSLGPIRITATGCIGAGCSAGVTYSNGTYTIQPGAYDDICVDSNLRVNFSDGGSSTGGLFIITGASTCNSNYEFLVNGGSTVCNSTNNDCSGMPGSANSGVTFYITGSASAFIAGTATVQLTAPNSGTSTYEGLLFYQDPSDSAGMTLLGNSSSFYQGAIYLANTSAILTFGGDTTSNDSANFNSLAAYTVIDVGDLQLNGNPDININSNYSSLAGGGGPLASAISKAILVE